MSRPDDRTAIHAENEMGIGMFGALLGSAFQTAFPGPRGEDGRYYALHAGRSGTVAQARRAAKKKRNRARN